MDFVISVLSSRGELLVQIKFHNRNQLITMTDVSIVLWPGVFVTNKTKSTLRRRDTVRLLQDGSARFNQVKV